MMEELPIAAESTEAPDSPGKDAYSVPSTDDESAYHDENQGVEIDDVSTLIAVNDDDCATPEQDAPNVVPVNNSGVVHHKKENKKKKRLSSMLFAKKVKRSARAAPPAADQVPGLVRTTSEDNVSSLAVPRVDKNLKPGSIEGEENTDIGRRSSADSKEKGVEISNPVHLANNTVPMTDSTKRTKRKSLRLFSKKDITTMPPSSPPPSPSLSLPSTINVKTQAPSMPVVEDDLSDAAVGIGRKWALFFHREKGEIDEDSDDASQEEEDMSFAVPASDISAVGRDPLSSPVTDKEAGNLEEDCSVEARKDDSKTEVLRETALVMPEASEEPISLNEQTISAETKEISSTVQASKVAPIDSGPGEDHLPEETLAEVAAAGEAEPREPTTAATSPSSPKRKTWGLLPNRNKPAVIDAERDTVSTNNMETINTSVDVTTEADTSVEKGTSNESVTQNNISSSNASEECSIFSGVDDDDQYLEKVEDPVAKERIHSGKLKQAEDDESKSEEERSKEEPSDSGGIFASVIAALMTSVLINDTGDVEVAAGLEGSTEECETAVVNMQNTGESLTEKDDFSESEAMETIDMADEMAAPENSVSSEDDNESVPSGKLVGESPISPVSVIAQRKAHLAAFDDESKEDKDSSRDDAVSKERSQRVLDSSLIDEDSVDLNHFPKQLDDESVGGETVETELIDSGRKCNYHPTCRFDDREFDEGYELMVCGTAVPTCQGMNVQYETEAKLASCVANFDLENFNALIPCGRSSDTVGDKSVHPGSEVAPSEAALSSDGSAGGNPDDFGINAMQLLDDFYEETSLDESFWSALDGRTIQSASDHSGSIRKLKKLLDDCEDSDLEDSVFDTVAERDDEDTVESIGHEVVAEPRYVVPSSPDEDIEGTESLLDEASFANDESKDNANTAVKESVEKDDTLKGSKQKAGSKSSDKAVEDIKKAMSTLKKYASRYGISEPELLWRIQKEHKKRKGWSASMAEF